MGSEAYKDNSNNVKNKKFHVKWVIFKGPSRSQADKNGHLHWI